MLALHVGPAGGDQSLLAKIAASLGLIVGIDARTWGDGDAGYASLPSIASLPPRAARRRHRWPAWQPARTPSGKLALFHGWIDNHHALAHRLAVNPNDLAALYGAAVDRWGDRADLELEGNYCAIIHDPDRNAVRLSRSVLAAPPLHYFQNGGTIGAASVPRALELMGVERRLDTRKLVDALYFNPTGDEGFLQGTWRVGLGEVVHLEPAGRRTLRYYDPLTVPLGWRKGDPRELIAECDRLLEQACRLALTDARNPAATLTGGLDSTNVAARLLRLRGPERGLNTLTFVPAAGHGQPPVPYRNLDERAVVEAFAARNPGIAPHFTDNAGIQFDHRLEQLFLAMGTGQTCTAVNFRYHGILARAADLGCDWVFTAELSGVGFSAPGDWAYGEFLRRGEWERLAEALRADSWGERTMGRKLLSRAVIPSLPLPLWRAWKALRGQAPAPQNRQIAGLTAQALAEHDVAARARAAGVSYERDQYGYRHEWLTDCLARGDIESADWTQAMEQIYEVRMRDVPANRALLEFCLSLPSEMFLREGQLRWLGRELARGIMPEEQRLSRTVGTQHTDWHALLTPRVPEMRAALRGARTNPDLSFLDFDQLEATLDHWPAEATLDDAVYFPCGYALPRALAMIRYVNFMTGRNAAS
ncbi:MAG: asparagine synthase-related protein [Novosphingobium sp.]